jgi:hypothetical protein
MNLVHLPCHDSPICLLLLLHLPIYMLQSPSKPLCRSKPISKKKQKGSKSSSKALWSSAEGWAAFDASDELLLGAEEGGFAGLEVLEDVSLIDAGELFVSLHWVCLASWRWVWGAESSGI